MIAIKSGRLATGALVLLQLVGVLFWTGAGYAVERSPAELSGAGPLAVAYGLGSGLALEPLRAVSHDWTMIREEDEVRDELGLAPRFAVGEDIWVTPENSGVWEDLTADFVLWRTRLSAPGALSLNLGFTGYWLPAGARLTVYPTDVKGPDDRRGQPVFTARDNADHGELWTPVILSDDIVVELVLPRSERYNYRLELTVLNQGYRFFGEPRAAKAGPCNIDVVCGEGDGWRPEINSVAAFSTGGSLFCTGVMMNNTAQDGKPYFLTANHCNINLGTAPSIVVYWNFQSPVCGEQSGGSLAQFTSGATFLASSSGVPAQFKSDFTLIELDEAVDPAFGVTYAGWDRSSADPVTATAIHHPRGDEKSISFETDPATTTSYLQTLVPGDETHIRIADWDVGTTEPGSSGCPLFNEDHHVVGQLHGGYAACGNDESDWFGRLSVSWDGAGTPTTRLRDYLDPLGSGVMSLDLLDPDAESFVVTPGTADAAAGVVGGPFTPTEYTFEVANNGAAVVAFEVSADAAWLSLSAAGGELVVGQSSPVTAALNDEANALPVGQYTATVSFVNPGGGAGTTSREIALTVSENVFRLVGPVPNPFTVAPVAIRYTLRGAATVRARIADVRGRAVRDLGAVAGAAGENSIAWDGRDDHGHRVPSGLYAVKIEALGRVYRANVSYVH